jgi:hypothetical protein
MGDGALGDSPTGDAWYVMRAFVGKRWQDLTTEELRTGHDALGMMTPEGFRYYLPAYLVLTLQDPKEADVEADKTRGAISPPPFDYGDLEAFETRISLLSLQERIAIAYFCEYLRRSEEHIPFSDEPIDRVTYYWQRYYLSPELIEANEFLRSVKPLRAESKSVSKRDLINTIKEAFADVAMPSAEQLSIPAKWKLYPWIALDEISLARFLKGKRWQSLNSSDVNHLSGSLKVMTPEGIRYYLPGFLTAIIEEPTRILDNALKSTVWALSPPPFGVSSKEDFDERIRLLTHDKRICISDFFNYLRYTEYFLSQFWGSEPYQHLTCFWDSPECYRALKPYENVKKSTITH